MFIVEFVLSFFKKPNEGDKAIKTLAAERDKTIDNVKKAQDAENKVITDVEFGNSVRAKYTRKGE